MTTLSIGSNVEGKPVSQHKAKKKSDGLVISSARFGESSHAEQSVDVKSDVAKKISKGRMDFKVGSFGQPRRGPRDSKRRLYVEYTIEGVVLNGYCSVSEGKRMVIP